MQQRHVVVLNEGKVVTAEMLNIIPHESSNSLNNKNNSENALSRIVITSDEVIRPFREIEEKVIRQAIDYCEGNITRAAKLLEIGKTTIFNKLKQYNSK